MIIINNHTHNFNYFCNLFILKSFKFSKSFITTLEMHIFTITWSTVNYVSF